MRAADDQPSVNVLLRADPIMHYTIKSTVNGHSMLKHASAVVVVMAGSILLSPRSQAAFVLSGASAFSTDSSGGFTNPNRWNTAPGDPWYNIYFTSPNAGTGGAFLNSGDGTMTNLQYTLTAGTYQFYMFADPGGNSSSEGLNLFFNDATTVAAISVFAPLATSATHPSFSADDNSDTLALDGSTVIPGSGSLSATFGDLTVRLTDYSWSDPSVLSLDRVGPFSLGSDGANDFVGSITLTVTSSAVPEPTSILLLGAGVLGLVGCAQRRAMSPANPA